MRDELSILIKKKAGAMELAAVREYPANKRCHLHLEGYPGCNARKP